MKQLAPIYNTKNDTRIEQPVEIGSDFANQIIVTSYGDRMRSIVIGQTFCYRTDGRPDAGEVKRKALPVAVKAPICNHCLQVMNFNFLQMRCVFSYYAF